jgi:hypothetical protein
MIKNIKFTISLLVPQKLKKLNFSMSSSFILFVRNRVRKELSFDNLVVIVNLQVEARLSDAGIIEKCNHSFEL